jgi:hypothetical protein
MVFRLTRHHIKQNIKHIKWCSISQGIICNAISLYTILQHCLSHSFDGRSSQAISGITMEMKCLSQLVHFYTNMKRNACKNDTIFQFPLFKQP